MSKIVENPLLLATMDDYWSEVFGWDEKKKETEIKNDHKPPSIFDNKISEFIALIEKLSLQEKPDQEK